MAFPPLPNHPIPPPPARPMLHTPSSLPPYGGEMVALSPSDDVELNCVNGVAVAEPRPISSAGSNELRKPSFPSFAPFRMLTGPQPPLHVACPITSPPFVHVSIFSPHKPPLYASSLLLTYSTHLSHPLASSPSPRPLCISPPHSPGAFLILFPPKSSPLAHLASSPLLESICHSLPYSPIGGRRDGCHCVSPPAAGARAKA